MKALKIRTNRFVTREATRKFGLLRLAFAMAVLLMLALPARLGGSNCCSGDTGESKCEEKHTKVYWRFSAGGSGVVRVEGRYTDDDRSVISSEIDCRSPDWGKEKCGSFCAEDGRDIEITINAVYQTPPPSTSTGTMGIGGSLRLGWGCDGKEGIYANGNEWQKEDHDNATFSTGESNACAEGNFGDGSTENGSVHAEWNLGNRLGDYLPSIRVAKASLPTMKLRLNALPVNGCTPELLRIPPSVFSHAVQLQWTQPPPPPPEDPPDEPQTQNFYLKYSAPPIGEGNTAIIRRNQLVAQWLSTHPEYHPDDVVVVGDTLSDLPNIERVYANNLLVQLRTASGIVVFHRLNGHAFEMRFYDHAQVVLANHVAGQPYAVVPNAMALKKWRVETPEIGGELEANAVRVIEEPGSAATKTTLWTHNDGAWAMTTGNGLRTDWKKSDDLGGGWYQRTVKVLDAAQNILQQEVSNFDDFHRPSSIVRGIPGEEEWTSYVYSGTGENASVWIFRSNSYEKHSYAGSRSELPFTETIIRPWLDIPSDAATTANARATETRTENAGSGRLQTVTEKIAGVVVSKTTIATTMEYHSEGDVGRQPVEVTTTQHFATNAEGVLTGGAKTVRKVFDGGAAERVRGRLVSESRISPQTGNEELTTCSYESGEFHLTGEGAPFSRDAAGLDLLIRTIHYPSGPSGRTTKEIRITRPDGTVPYEEFWVTPVGSECMRVQKKFHTYDARRNRVSTVVDAGSYVLRTETGSDSSPPGPGAEARTTYSAEYAGDLLISETDETGVITTYSNHDAFQRPSMTTRANIADGNLTVLPSLITQRTYDVLGRLSTEVQHTAQGAALNARSTLYDSLGRTRSETINGQLTTFAYDVNAETRTGPGGETVMTETYIDGQTKRQSGSGVVATSYGYSVVGELVRETVTRGTGTETVETATERNGQGQTIREKIAAPGNAWRSFQYDDLGRLTGERANGTTLRGIVYEAAENPLAVTTTIFATPDPARTEERTSRYVLDDDIIWQENLAADGSRSREKLSGLTANELAVQEYRAANGRTVTTTTVVDRANARVTMTAVDSATANPAVTISRGGAVVSTKTAEKPAPTLTSNDALGRATSSQDTATGAVTTYFYDFASGAPRRIQTTSAGATTTTIDNYLAGQLQSRMVDGNITYFSYTPRGELAQTWGATYPLKYEYDSAGRLKKLHTYRADPGTGEEGFPNGDTTEWLYVPRTTLLQQKKDAAGAGPVYGYDGLGRLQERRWGRTVNGQPLKTTYTYNLAGQLRRLDYSDATPDVTFTHDSRGRVATRQDGAGTASFSYAGVASEQVEEETRSDGTKLHYGRDSAGRETSYWWWDGQRFATWGGWGYDAASGRLNGAGTAAGWVSYNDTQGAGWSEREAALGGQVRTRWRRDGLGRWQRLSTLVGNATPTPLAARRYEYSAGRVSKVHDSSTTNNGEAWADGPRWQYNYNERGEVMNAVRQLSSGATVPGLGLTYNYDMIGNRITTSRQGRSRSWIATALNQYTAATQASSDRGLHVLGEAEPAATVRVNNQLTTRQGATFYSWIAGGTGAASLPKWQAVTVTKENPSAPAVNGRAYVPPQQESFGYDADGNLTSDGRWLYTWDAENRLVAMETRWTTAQVLALPQLRLEFSYDGLSRRTGKTVKQRAGGNWVTIRRTVFTYEGWNLIAEQEVPSPFNSSVPSTSFNLLRTYHWGPDLSGSRQGAGGVGGLLCLNTHQANGTIQSYYPCYGDNGNIEALLDVSNPEAGIGLAAAYEYGPFGELLRATGPMAVSNPFRWSTKYVDQETGLSYYGYRYYDPSKGRWLNRDPIEENGGHNIYCYCVNNSVSKFDARGLASSYITGDDLIKMAKEGAAEALRQSMAPVMNWQPVPNSGLNSQGPSRTKLAEFYGGICSCVKNTDVNPKQHPYVRTSIRRGDIGKSYPVLSKVECNKDLGGILVAYFHSHPNGNASADDKALVFNQNSSSGQPNPLYQIPSYIGQWQKWKKLTPPIEYDYTIDQPTP